MKNNLTSMRLHGKAFNSTDHDLYQDMLVCREYGITTVAQFIVFNLCCEYEGCLFQDLLGMDSSSPEFKVYRPVLRKLMEGSKSRDDGLYLITYANDKIRGTKSRGLILTEKGRSLSNKLTLHRKNLNAAQ